MIQKKKKATLAPKLKKRFRLGTLKRRVSFILSVFMLLSLLLIVTVSFMSVTRYSVEQARVMLSNRLEQLAEQLDGTIYELVGISQQLSVDGVIGKKLVSYEQSDDPYGRIALTVEISEDINTVLFSHRKISLAGYYVPNEVGQIMYTRFMTFTMEADAKLRDELPWLLESNKIKFHAIHPSLSMLNDKPTISIIHETTVEGKPLMVYVESYVDISQSLTITSQEQYPCMLVMRDSQGEVGYASDPSYVEGEGIYADALQVSMQSSFGFTYDLLMTAPSYQQLLYNWIKDLAIVLVITIMMVLITVTLLYRLIYKPIKVFSDEVETIGLGDLSPSAHYFEMREFDDLFIKVEEMKERISQLVDDVHESEHEKRQLEIDKLYYQINPHFVLNALNSLHWLAAASGQTEIVRYVHQLNSLLSYSLGKTREMITFRSELRVAEQYIQLQQSRYDFSFEMHIEEGAYLDQPCARLLLQPLLENAICHNMNEFGHLKLSMQLKDGEGVHIEIIDDGCGIAALEGESVPLGSDKINKGIGLKYLQGTLDAFYGGTAQVTLDTSPSGGTKVTLLLPLLRTLAGPEAPDIAPKNNDEEAKPCSPC